MLYGMDTAVHLMDTSNKSNNVAGIVEYIMAMSRVKQHCDS